METICIEEVIEFLKIFLTASVARFLESRGMIEDALEVATDPDYRFDLAVQLGRLEVAKVSPMSITLARMSMRLLDLFSILHFPVWPNFGYNKFPLLAGNCFGSAERI